MCEYDARQMKHGRLHVCLDKELKNNNFEASYFEVNAWCSAAML